MSLICRAVLMVLMCSVALAAPFLPDQEGGLAAVKEWLIKQGIDPSRLTSKGFGDTKPIDTNSTAEGRANNRRVEFARIQP